MSIQNFNDQLYGNPVFGQTYQPYFNQQLPNNSLANFNQLGKGNVQGNVTLGNGMNVGGNTGAGGNGWSFGGFMDSIGGAQGLASLGQTLAGMYFGNKQLKQGERMLGLQESAFNNNLTHKIQSYNTALADRANVRGFVQGDSQATTDAYINNNSLKRV